MSGRSRTTSAATAAQPRRATYPAGDRFAADRARPTRPTRGPPRRRAGHEAPARAASSPPRRLAGRSSPPTGPRRDPPPGARCPAAGLWRLEPGPAPPAAAPTDRTRASPLLLRSPEPARLAGDPRAPRAPIQIGSETATVNPNFREVVFLLSPEILDPYAPVRGSVTLHP